MKKSILQFFCLSLCLLIISSCAYQLRRGGIQGLSSQEGIVRVYVPVTDNLSAEAGPEFPLSNALREALATLQGVRVVNSADEAEFILLSRIKNWGRRVAGSSSLGSIETEQTGALLRNQYSAAEIRVFMDAEFEMLQKIDEASDENHKVQKILWKRSLSDSRVYEASSRFDEAAGSTSAPHINRSREEMQLRRISSNLARRVIDQVSQDF